LLFAIFTSLFHAAMLAEFGACVKYNFVVILFKLIIKILNMEELTIKVNKTALYSAGFLIVGIIVGFTLSNFVSVGFGKKINNEQVAVNNLPADNQPTGQNNQPAAASPGITLTASDHLRGGKNAQVVIVEYSDFQCPYCKNHYATMKQLMQEYGNKVAWVYRHYPLSFHANAQIAAEGSECAAEQGKFWEFADILFTKGQSDGTGLDPNSLEQYAKDLGLNSSQFDNCLATKKYASHVNADQASAGPWEKWIQDVQKDNFGVPANIILDKNGKAKLVAGAVPYEQLKAEIDAAMK